MPSPSSILVVINQTVSNTAILVDLAKAPGLRTDKHPFVTRQDMHGEHTNLLLYFEDGVVLEAVPASFVVILTALLTFHLYISSAIHLNAFCCRYPQHVVTPDQDLT